MMRRSGWLGKMAGLALWAVGCLAVVPAWADVRLPAVIGDNMVVQQGMAVPIWGWADQGESVTVSFLGQTKSAQPAACGKWMLKLDPVQAGGPCTMIIQGKNTIVLKNMLHPKNKQDVGKRLALSALAKDYGKDVVYSGPMYKSMEKKGKEIVLHFDHVGGGLVAKDGPLKGFAVAGEDRKFVWADAKIDGDTIIASSPQVANPVTVRYAWADNPVCNLYNQEGLPACPFRTDDWPGITINNH